jgi:predicted nuclease with TOPRIM domain
MNVNQSIRPAPQVVAWRVKFANEAQHGNVKRSSGRGATKLLVEQSIMEVEDILVQDAGGQGDTLDMIWVEQGRDSIWDPEGRLESWLAEANQSRQSILRAGLRTIQVIWARNRVVLFASGEHLEDAQDAVFRFTSLAWKLEGLEKDMDEVWPILESHIPLLHSVKRRQHKLQNSIDAMTDRTNRMSVKLIKLYEEFDQLDAKITPTSKRLFSELCDQAAIEDRMEAIEDPVQNAVEHYEMVNDRMIESKNAYSSKVLETLIVIVLLLELGLNLSSRVDWNNLVGKATAAVATITDYKGLIVDVKSGS